MLIRNLARFAGFCPRICWVSEVIIATPYSSFVCDMFINTLNSSRGQEARCDDYYSRLISSKSVTSHSILANYLRMSSVFGELQSVKEEAKMAKNIKFQQYRYMLYHLSFPCILIGLQMIFIFIHYILKIMRWLSSISWAKALCYCRSSSDCSHLWLVSIPTH